MPELVMASNEDSTAAAPRIAIYEATGRKNRKTAKMEYRFVGVQYG